MSNCQIVNIIPTNKGLISLKFRIRFDEQVAAFSITNFMQTLLLSCLYQRIDRIEWQLYLTEQFEGIIL